MFSFEVKDSDLLGRVGTLKVGGRVLETPYMFPVIHPVTQSVALSSLREMGFDGVMTNSYIIHSRKKKEALERGIHELIGFAGVVMTDSGGYQVLKYGDIELGHRDVAEFQTNIGSDLAVTLDRPTGYPQSRKFALESVEYSVNNAKSTLREFSSGSPVWVGPIQGGLHLDLVRRSAASLVKAGFGFLALGSPVQVMQNYMFADLAKMVMAARKATPYAVPMHLFGAGHPLTMSLAVALGCDTFDSASYIIFARSGRYMSSQGVMTVQTMKYLPCSCQVCSKTSIKELLELPYAERTRRLAIHNLYVLAEELNAAKEAISEGRLWDLVEEKSMAHPRLREAFVELAKESKQLSLGTPALKDRGLFVRSDSDLSRPELKMAASRLEDSIDVSTKNAVIVVPNKGHNRKMKGRPVGDAYLVHPLLGPYPAELEFQYPFSQTEVAGGFALYDLAGSKKILKRRGYSRVTAVGRASKNRRSRTGASPAARGVSARSR